MCCFGAIVEIAHYSKSGRSTSGTGHKRKVREVQSMSALPPKADISLARLLYPFCAISGHIGSQRKTLFEHFMDTGERA